MYYLSRKLKDDDQIPPAIAFGLSSSSALSGYEVIQTLFS